MITTQEREAALERLRRSRQALIDAVEGVTDSQARWQSEEGRWTILEYVEHLAVSDGELILLVERALQSPPRPETPEERRVRELKIRNTPMPRGVNHAPPRLRPGGRFGSLADAIAAFLEARERTLEYARNTQAELRDHFADHPVLGPMDAYQWLVANARHAESHAGHIREIRSLAGFPGE